MAIDRESVLAIAPELSTVVADDAQWELALQLAAEFTSEARLGSTSRWELAQKLFVAHYLTVAQSGAADITAPAGPLTGETYGPVSKTYAAPAQMPGLTQVQFEFGKTQYGQSYLALVRPSGLGGTVA